MAKGNDDRYFDYLKDLSISELEDLKAKAEEKEAELMKNWAFELNEILSEKDFDRYSRKGEKRLNKFTEHHAELLAGALDYIDLIDDELAMRDGYVLPKEKDSYSSEDYDDLTTEEFLKLEREKIEQTRKTIKTEDNEN